jgi:hypothetical protein
VSCQPHAEADLLALKEFSLRGLGLRAGLNTLEIAESLPFVGNQTLFSWPSSLYQSLFLLNELQTSLSHTQIDFEAHLQICKKRLLAASCPSLCLSTWNNSDPTGWIFMKFDIRGFFENVL